MLAARQTGAGINSAAARRAQQQRHARPLAAVTRQRAPLAPPPRGIGKDAVDGWLDLAKLVAGADGGGRKGAYDELAYRIGRDVYVDIAGWHLFLRDMSAVPGLKMAAALAAQLGPAAADAGRSGLREADVAAALRRVPVDVGGGRVTLSLYDVMPSACVSDLVRLLGEWARDQ